MYAYVAICRMELVFELKICLNIYDYFLFLFLLLRDIVDENDRRFYFRNKSYELTIMKNANILSKGNNTKFITISY